MKQKDLEKLDSPLPFRQDWLEFFEQHGVASISFRRFRSIIYHYYFGNRREFPWRNGITPYRVFVSEVMLQQTQTIRVIPKFNQFMLKFPDFQTLAAADFREILGAWKGLGYNRRARYLQESAQIIIDRFEGVLPDNPDLLVTLPGIGPATAASICTFAFNIALGFIETNIRTVYIHFFFRDSNNVHDRQIMDVVAKTIDKERPREWYYALMDYGVMLKRVVGNLNQRSSHYSKQSPFEGSNRQVRGKILELLLERGEIMTVTLPILLSIGADRTEKIIHSLCDDNLVVEKDNKLVLE